MIKKTFWILLVIMAIVIGLYPSLYFIIDRRFGLLASKDTTLLINLYWNIGFYTHIILGGLALLIGWMQFSPKIRAARLNLHRQIGKMYIISSLLSSLASLYIALYATGGVISALGFSCLGIAWFFTTLIAYKVIRNRKIDAHERMMIYSYACCLAAVTLRIWLPLLASMLNDFITAYRIVAWLCWVPNLFIAFLIIEKIKNKKNLSGFQIERSQLIHHV